MAVLPVCYEDATDELKSIYADIKTSFSVDDVPNWALFLGSQTQILAMLVDFTKKVYAQESIPQLLRELIIFCVSVSNEADYCRQYHAHSALSLSQGMTYQDLENMLQGNSSAYIPERYVKIIEATKAYIVSNCPSKSKSEDLRSSCENDDEYKELVNVIALATLFNTYTKAFEIPIDESAKILDFNKKIDSRPF